jgi:hypothetical protein
MGRNGSDHDELSLSYVAGATAWSATRLPAPNNDRK